MDLKRAKVIQARVWPHNHKNEFGGPLDVKIGVTSQPDALRGWDKKVKPLIALEQPNAEETNLTVLRVLFLKNGSPPDILKDTTLHRANVWGLQELPVPPFGGELSDQQVKDYRAEWKRLKPSHLTVYLKARYTKALPHPVPLGKWDGTVIDDEGGRWVLFTLQAMTLAVQKQEKKRNLILPGDPDFDAPPNYKELVR